MSDGDTITAALFNNEYNQLVNAFTYSSSSASTTGHRHDGTAGQGGNIHTIGDLDFLNKIVVDSTNNRWGFFVQVSSSAVEQIRIQDGAIVPVTDNDIDLGTSSLEFKDGYFDGTLYADAINFNGTAISATAAELNILDGVTSTAAELNILDGVTATAAELNYSDTGSSVGTVVASKVVTVDSNKDVASFRNVTLTGELDAGSLDISGDADIDGTTNLDAVDIDGAVQVDGTITVGVDDTGYDVKFFGATASSYMLWDESEDDLVLAGSAGIDLAGDIDVDGTANLDNTDIDGTLAVDGTTISLDATTSLNIDNSNTSNGITIGTVTSGVPISIGHSTSEVTINDNLTVTGTLTLGSGAELSEAELEMLDGITEGTVAASKAVVVDSNKDAASFRNITLTGELDAATLDISGDADIDGTLETDALSINGTSVTATAAEINILDGVTSTAAELNILDGVTSTTAELNILDGVTSTTAELNILDGVTSTAAELNILDGVTSTAAEINTLDGITAVVGELNALDLGSTAVGTAIASKAVILDANKDYTGLRNLTITGELDAATLDISGNVDVDGTLETDALSINGTTVTSTAAELNILDGVTATAAEINILDGVTSTTAELNILDGVTSTTAELNILDGVTSTTAELNILDGVTSTTAELNVLDPSLKEDNSIYIGSDPSGTTDSAQYNTALGVSALDAITTGDYNVAFGASSLSAATATVRNSAIGYAALKENVNGSYNSCVGMQALGKLAPTSPTNTYNTTLGYRAGYNLETGIKNTLLGANSDTTATDSNQAVGIGYGLDCEGGYTTVGNGSSDIRAAHGTATWSTVSDERYKKDILDSSAGLNFINALRPRTFKYKTLGELPETFRAYEEGSSEAFKNSLTNHGFIAQEVKAVIDADSTIQDGFKLWAEREDGSQELAEAALTPVLVKAIQEQQALIESLTARIDALEG